MEGRRRCIDSLENKILSGEDTSQECVALTSVSLDDLSYQVRGFENISFDHGSLESIFLGGSASPVETNSPKFQRNYCTEDLFNR